MSKTHVLLIVAIWSTIGALCGPEICRRMQAPPSPAHKWSVMVTNAVPSRADGLWYAPHGQTGIIFYTAPDSNFALETATCSLPSGVIPTGK